MYTRASPAKLDKIRLKLFKFNLSFLYISANIISTVIRINEDSLNALANIEITKLVKYLFSFKLISRIKIMKMNVISEKEYVAYATNGEKTKTEILKNLFLADFL